MDYELNSSSLLPPSSHADYPSSTGAQAAMAKQAGIETHAVASAIVLPFSGASGLTWDVASTTPHRSPVTPGGSPTSSISQVVAPALTSGTPSGPLPSSATHVEA